MPAYYCYQCKQTVQVDQGLHCSQCDGEFIEEVREQPQQPTLPTIIGESPFSFVFQGGSTPSGSNPPDIGTVCFNHVFSEFQLMRSFLQSSQPGSSSYNSTAPFSDAGNEARFRANDPFMGFFNQVLANLSAGVPTGGQVHIQINGSNGPVATNIQNYAAGDINFDQIITQLLNGYEQSVGISDNDLKRIPISNITQEHVNNGTQCTTCMETFNLEEEVGQLECKHVFHIDCIVPWLKRQKTCPICRHEVNVTKWPSGPVKVITDIDELD